MRAPDHRSREKSACIEAALISSLLLILLFPATSIIGESQSDSTYSFAISARFDSSEPMAGSATVNISAGQTLTVPVVVNNSFSNITWIVDHVSYTIEPTPSPISLSSNVLPFVTSVPNRTVSSIFNLIIRGPRVYKPALYFASVLISMRTTLLPPFLRSSTSFNVTINVVNTPESTLSIEAFLLWTAYVLVSLTAMGLVIRKFVQQLE